jgi:hypothetical protein
MFRMRSKAVTRIDAYSYRVFFEIRSGSEISAQAVGSQTDGVDVPRFAAPKLLLNYGLVDDADEAVADIAFVARVAL